MFVTLRPQLRIGFSPTTRLSSTHPSFFPLLRLSRFHRASFSDFSAIHRSRLCYRYSSRFPSLTFEESAALHGTRRALCYRHLGFCRYVV
jgi:hypothetical protein